MSETFNGLPSVSSHHLLQPRIHADDLARLDFDIRGGSLKAGRGLMDKNARIGQGRAFAFGAPSEQDSPHAGRHTDARRPDLGLDEMHGVVDRQASIDLPTWAVDVHLDVVVWILLREVQQLRHDQVRDHIVDGRAQEDDAILQEQRKDVVAALSTIGLLDHHRD